MPMMVFVSMVVVMPMIVVVMMLADHEWRSPVALIIVRADRGDRACAAAADIGAFTSGLVGAQ